MIKKFWHRQQGDTIVEVLISLAILTFVLGGAYYTANKSYRNDRDSQEHTEAITVEQTQLEDLRAYGSVTISLGNSICFNNSGGTLSTLTGPCYISNISTGKAFSGVNASNTCLTTAPVPQYCYEVKITELPTTTINTPATLPAKQVKVNTYEVLVSWPALSGGTDQVYAYYRWDD